MTSTAYSPISFKVSFRHSLGFKANFMENDGVESLDMSDSDSAHNSSQESRSAVYNSWKGVGEPPSEIGHTIDNDDDDDDYTDLEEQDILLKDRRRAKSLPAYPEQANLFEEISRGCRKRVKFADALGLNLASVKHFSTTDDPQIPSKVFLRLQSFPPQPDRELFGDLCDKFKSTFTVDRLVPTFEMPVERSDFETRFNRSHITLEIVTVTRFDVRGVIRALTSGCCKREVGVRYTFNDWLSFMDAQAVPMSGEDNGAVGEKFMFTMYTPPIMDPSSSVHFAVYAKTEHGEFWDNNDGENYTLKYQCISTYATTAFLPT